MACEGQVYRTKPFYSSFNGLLQAVNLGLRIDRTDRTCLDGANDISRSYPFSGSVFFCVQGNVYHFLEDFEGTLVVPPPLPGVPPFYNYELLVMIPNRIHEVWHGGEWFIRLETKLGRTMLELESPMYDTAHAIRDPVEEGFFSSDAEDDNSEEQQDDTPEPQQQDSRETTGHTLLPDDGENPDQWEASVKEESSTPAPFPNLRLEKIMEADDFVPRVDMMMQQSRMEHPNLFSQFPQLQGQQGLFEPQVPHFHETRFQETRSPGPQLHEPQFQESQFPGPKSPQSNSPNSLFDE